MVVYMIYTNYYVESLISVLKRYSAPISFKVNVDALIGEKYAELSISDAVDGEFKEIKNVVSGFVEIHLIPIYATDVEMKLTDIDLNHDNDKTVVLSDSTPYLIVLPYDADNGVKAECDSDGNAEIVGSIIEFLDIDVSGDGYISEKSFLEFGNVEVTVYESDDELKVVDLLKHSGLTNATASEIKGGLNGEC